MSAFNNRKCCYIASSYKQFHNYLFVSQMGIQHDITLSHFYIRYCLHSQKYLYVQSIKVYDTVLQIEIAIQQERKS